MVCGPTAFLALWPLLYLRETAPVPFPGSQSGPSSLTASAASRRYSLRLGAEPGAGTGVFRSDGGFGGPGLTAASPKALIRNRVHWTHLFPFDQFHGVVIPGQLSTWELGPFAFSSQWESLSCTSEYPFPGVASPAVHLAMCPETEPYIGTSPSFWIFCFFCLLPLSVT